MTSKPQPTRRSGARLSPTGADNVTRTIEQIEARAAEVLDWERAALGALAHCIREIAVQLPVESRLPLDLAKAATALETFAGGENLLSMGVKCALWPPTGLAALVADYMPLEDDGDGS